MLRVTDAHIRYGGVDVLRGVSFTVAPGEIVALAGPNGAGKSTLACLACAALLADAGCVSVDGIDPASGEEARLQVRRLVGMVQQDSADQIVSTIVFDEVAFGPRNLGLSEGEVAHRVTEALESVGLAGFEPREVGALSGGELQRVALAGVLAMRPRYLVLDEVTAMLDSALRPALRALFRRLADAGVGILTVTHDPAELVEADRAIRLGGQEAPSDKESPSWQRSCHEGRLNCGGVSTGLELRSVSYTYPDAASPTIHDVSLAVRPGEVLLLAGCSGSGKSTLASLVAGLAAPFAGEVLLGGAPVAPAQVGLAFQRPEAQLFLNTVYDEIAFAPRNLGCTEDEVERRVHGAACLVGLSEGLLARNPFELSGGQQRRVGLAGVLSLEAAAYVLDEPTAGLDAAGRAALHGLVHALAEAGAATVVISHDIEEWLAEADRVALLRDGAVIWQGSAADAVGREDVWVDAGLLQDEVPHGSIAAMGDKVGADANARAEECLESEGAPFGCNVPCDSETAAGGKVRVGASVQAGERLQSGGASFGCDVPHGSEAAVRDQASAECRPRVRRSLQQDSKLGLPGKPSLGSGASPLASVDARVKVILLLAFTVAVFAARTAPALGIGFLALAVTLRMSGLGLKAIAPVLKPAALILILVLLANLVACDGSATVPLAGMVGLDPAGGLRGAGIALRIVLLLGFSFVVAKTTTPPQLCDAAVRLLRPLARFGVPVGDIGMALSIALRFIPLVAEEFHRVRRAQLSRGARFDAGGLLQRIRAYNAVLIPLVVGLFRRADRLAAAMEARCYADGVAQVPPQALAHRDIIALVVGLAVCAVTCLISPIEQLCCSMGQFQFEGISVMGEGWI